MIIKLEHFLKNEGFYYIPSEQFDEVYSGKELIEHEGWNISLDIPNGGILAVGIQHIKSSACWEKSTYREYGYLDSDGIMAYAKAVITSCKIILKS